MKALRFHNYGSPAELRYEDIPEPRPKQGEVLVKVHAAGVNPVDAAVRAGVLRRVREYPLPFVPGWDFSGVVADVGDGVTEWGVGDEVFGHPPLGGAGTYAEYIAVPASVCARKPKSLDHVHAAGVPLAALTAWQALFEHAGAARGQRVLIQRGAGGVGIFAIQCAAMRDLEVFATASAGNLPLLVELGATHAIDYRTTKFEDVASSMDAVIEGMAGEVRERSWTTLKPEGILIALTGAPPFDATAAERGYRQKTMWVRPDSAQLTEIASLIDLGKVRVVVDSVFPLQDGARAHERIETGHARGKVVLQVV